jgi:hypothetical protein
MSNMYASRFVRGRGAPDAAFVPSKLWPLRERGDFKQFVKELEADEQE